MLSDLILGIIIMTLGQELWKLIEKPQGYAFISDDIESECDNEKVIQRAKDALEWEKKVVEVLSCFVARHEKVKDHDVRFLSDKQKKILMDALEQNNCMKIRHGKQKWSLYREGLIEFVGAKQQALTAKGREVAIQLKRELEKERQFMT